jgi:threonine/homoserine/homoserine lactone efflux protein
MLPELTVLAAFLLASITLIVLPGPDTFYVAARSLHQGPMAGLIATLGIQAGCIVHVTAAAFGISSLFAYAPATLQVIRYAGAIYLLYLAWGTIVGGDSDEAAAAPLPPMRPWRILWQAALTNLLNPKVILFFLAFLPQFARPDAGPVWLQMASLGAIFLVLGATYLVTVAAIAGSIGTRLRRHTTFRRAQRWITGTTLGGLAIWLAVADRR